MDPDVLTSAGRVLLDVGGLLFGAYLASMGGAWSVSRLRRARSAHNRPAPTLSKSASGTRTGS